MAPDPRGDRSAPVIECSELVVRYGDTVAVDGLSFTAEAGQVVALLGPNGAGKTSTVETLEGYQAPSAGAVHVLGLDPRARKADLVARMGVMLQRGGVYPTMAAGRVLELFAAYYDDPEEPGALLEQVGLSARSRTPWRRLSGGEQQRLSLALALVGRPEVLFLDEPTAGIDPEGRIAIRRVIAERRDAGACVLLTTHELTEAERLADDVVILAAGRAVARGSVAELAGAGGQGGIHFAAPEGIDLDALAAEVGAPRPEVQEIAPGSYRIGGEPTAARLAAVARFLEERGLPVSELRAGGRSLEDVYLSLVSGSGVAT
ncbi:MAG: ABC transporter ATP-binding protein [Acidimicrobiales bacterium]